MRERNGRFSVQAQRAAGREEEHETVADIVFLSLQQ
jgi:hypothetical protein